MGLGHRYPFVGSKKEDEDRGAFDCKLQWAQAKRTATALHGSLSPMEQVLLRSSSFKTVKSCHIQRYMQIREVT